MAKYRQVHTSFWQDTFVLDLTPEEKYFYLYLLTNSKTSACGIYELPKKVMEMETGYNRETVDKFLARFIEYGKVAYCEATKEVYLINWLRFNEPKSDLTAKCVIAELNAVKNRAFAEQYLDQADDLGYALEGAYRGLDSPYQVKEMEKEKEKETEKESDAGKPAAPVCPHDEIIALYHELLPTCPHVKEWHAARKTHLKARWREDPKRQNLDWWRKYFAYVAKSDFLMGRAKPREGSVPFMATLEWLVKQGNFAKVIEGQYHREAA